LVIADEPTTALDVTTQVEVLRLIGRHLRLRDMGVLDDLLNRGQPAPSRGEGLADAIDAGIPHLVGTTLLQDYRPKGPGHWAGRVYVPDMGRTFYSTIDQQGPDQLKISGCILGGLFCRSQLWHRVKTG
jgi:hypothetical protein